MKLTKTLTVALHRKLWHWIADETERQKRCVEKKEYPLFHRFIIDCDCWCCEYTPFDCNICPIQWRIDDDSLGQVKCILSEFGDWSYAVNIGDWREAARIARIIAELPERDV